MPQSETTQAVILSPMKVLLRYDAGQCVDCRCSQPNGHIQRYQASVRVFSASGRCAIEELWTSHHAIC